VAGVQVPSFYVINTDIPGNCNSHLSKLGTCCLLQKIIVNGSWERRADKRKGAVLAEFGEVVAICSIFWHWK
jgi:hypothetical protein